MLGKGQTATEYIVITAVVIVVSLVIAGVLGVFPGLGSESSEDSNDASLITRQIGVTNYAIGPIGTKINFQNNNVFPISLYNITIEGTDCSPSDPVTIKVGGIYEHSCTSVTHDVGDYRYDMDLEYTNLDLDQNFLQTDMKLIGTVGSFFIEGANQAPQVSLSAPTAGNYSGGSDIIFTVSDDNKTSSLTAEYYYSSTPGGFENLIDSEDLLVNCFQGDSVITGKTCTYLWGAADPGIVGEYYIDARVYDGELYGSDSIGVANITACTDLTDGLVITTDTSLCAKTYDIDPAGSQVISFGASGTANDYLTLDCRGATIQGTGTYGISSTNRAYLETKNCNIFNYTRSYHSQFGDYHRVHDSNFSGFSGGWVGNIRKCSFSFYR